MSRAVKMVTWSRRVLYLAAVLFVVACVLRGPSVLLAVVLILFVGSCAGWLVGNWLGVRERLERNRVERFALGRVCPVCGYNMKATPLRCPECGRVVDAGGGVC